MFCDNCGSPILKSAQNCPGCKRSLNGGPTASLLTQWNSLYHAFVSVFPETTMSYDDLSDYYQSGGGWPPVAEQVEQNVPEGLLAASLISNFYEADYKKSVTLAERALGAAQKSQLDLGRYWFAYGCALQENNRPEDSLEAYENSLNSGFAEAALKLGFVTLQTHADLRGAVSIWRQGIALGSKLCEQKLASVEDAPGVYSAEVSRADGSIEVIMFSDRPGGLGVKMSDLGK